MNCQPQLLQTDILSSNAILLLLCGVTIFCKNILTLNILYYKDKTILNYDSQKGKEIGFFSGFNSTLLSLKKGIPEVSTEVQKLFGAVKSDDKFSDVVNILKSFDEDTIQDNLFKKWVEGLDEVDRASMTAGDALKQYKTHLAEIGKTTSLASKAGSAFKSILGNVASFAVNAGVIWAVSKALEVAINKWEEYSKAQENAIERGDKALSNMQQNQQKVASAQAVLENIKSDTVILSDGSEITRLEQLSKGVNSLGQNVSLTKDEFAEYNSMLEQMSNAGLNATSSMSNLESQINNLRKSANNDTLKGLGDWVDSFNSKNNQQVTDFTKEVGYQQQINALNKIYADPNLKNDNAQNLSKATWLDKASMYIQKFWNTIAEKDILNKSNDLLQMTQEKVYDDVVNIVTDTKALEEVAEQFSIDIFDEQGNFSYDKYSSDKVQQQIADAIDSLQISVESEVRNSAGYLKAIFENNKNFESLSEDATKMFEGIFDNIDYDTISQYMMDSNGMLNQQLIKDWVNGIAEKASNKDVQDQLNKLFSLNTLKDNIDLSKYKKQANNLITSISNAIPELSPELLKKTSGVEDTIKELETYYNRISNLYGKGNANQLNNRELKLAVDIIANDNFSGTFDELMKRINLAKTEINLEDSTLYDEVEKAFQSENRGDKYKKMVENLKTAKDLYDKGEIGSDDFKSVAKWLSPSGADDAMNFQ